MASLALLPPGEEEEEDVCRICRMAEEPDNPLFYPCKCSGSIRYVHQECLTEWLKHSGNTHCEVCKHKFSFTPVYAEDTPPTLPWHELVIGVLKLGFKSVKMAHRVWMVTSMWLILVPLCTCFAWRLAFLKSFSEVLPLLTSRFHLLALASDCIQGSVLSILIVFLNLSFNTVKDFLQTLLTTLERNLMRQAGPPRGEEHHHQEQPGAEGEAHVADRQLHNPIAGRDARDNFDDDIIGADFNDDGDVMGDVPFEELVGLQGPWGGFLETIFLVLVGNAFFMVVVVWLPLNLGRAILALINQYLAPVAETSNIQQVLGSVLEVVAPVLLAPGTGFQTVPFVETMDSHGIPLPIGAVAVVGNLSVPKPLGPTQPILLHNATQHLPPTTLHPNVENFIKELEANVATPDRADMLALMMGHLALSSMAFLALWAYISVRLLNVCRRRARWIPPLSLLRVIQSACQWAILSVSHLFRGLKLLLLLFVELGVFPLVCGFWLDLCAMPVTGNDLSSQWAAVTKSLSLQLVVHWAVGVAFMLGVTFTVMLLREVLRPGALPFLRDPTHPDRNPIREMMQKPLVHLMLRLGLSGVMYASLCVVLVHFPALLARGLSPGTFPFRVSFIDPFTQIPADMLLFHVCVPFTLEYMRVKGTLKKCIRLWLKVVGSLVGLGDYLLPEEEPRGQEGARAVGNGVPGPQANGNDSDGRAIPIGTERLSAGAEEPGGDTAGAATSLQKDDSLAQAVAVGTTAAHSASEATRSGGTKMLEEGPRLIRDPMASLAARPVSHPLSPSDGSLWTPSPSCSPELQGPPDLTSPPGSSVEPMGRDEATTSAQNGLGDRSGDEEHRGVEDAGSADSRVAEGAGGAARGPDGGADVGDLANWTLRQHEQHPKHSLRLLGLAVCWGVTMIALNTTIFIVPVTIGRYAFDWLLFPFMNDVYTFAVGLLGVWMGIWMAQSLYSMADLQNIRATARALVRWVVVASRCSLLAGLWLGVVAVMLGVLLDMALLPFRLYPNQTPLIYLYQDWTIGVLALKLGHLSMMLLPPGRLQERLGADAMGRHGPHNMARWHPPMDGLHWNLLRHVEFRCALFDIIFPTVGRLGVALAVPYVVTRGLVPYLPLPAAAIKYAQLYAYTVTVAGFVVYWAGQQVRRMLKRLHDVIRDDRYLVGRELNNFTAERSRAVAEAVPDSPTTTTEPQEGLAI